jgi:GNAT superfamily N-acetyltransferase
MFSSKTMVFYDFSYDRFAPGCSPSQDGLIVRQLHPEEVVALTEILYQQAKKETLFEPAYNVKDAADRVLQGEYCFVCEEDGKIVGYLWFCPTKRYIPEIQSTLKLQPGEVYVYNAYVLPEHRGRDIIPGLYKAARSLLAENGFKREIIARLNWNQSSESVLNKVDAVVIGDVTVGFFLTFRYVHQRCTAINLVHQGSSIEFYKKLFRKVTQCFQCDGDR